MEEMWGCGWGVYFLFSTRFPVKKGAKRRRIFFLGRRLLGAVGNAITRDHVLAFTRYCFVSKMYIVIVGSQSSFYIAPPPTAKPTLLQ